MAEVVYELLTTPAASEKLGRRGIPRSEAKQLVGNLNRVVPNERRSDRRQHKLHEHRLLMIGRTNGGRTLTLVIERTIDPTSWLIVTGWEATRRERRMFRR